MNTDELKSMNIDELRQKKQDIIEDIKDIETEIIDKRLKNCAEICKKIVDNRDFDKLDYIAQEIDDYIGGEMASCHILRHNGLYINNEKYEDKSGFGKNAMLLIKTYEWTFLWDFVEFFENEAKGRAYFFDNEIAGYICDFVENLKL